MMLEFDPMADGFSLDGIAIGRGTRPEDVQGRLVGEVSNVAGHQDYQNFDGRSKELNVALGFNKGELESGYFFAILSGEGSWDKLEEREAERRRKHEMIMDRLFNAPNYASPNLIVELVREPRNRTEQLRFQVP